MLKGLLFVLIRVPSLLFIICHLTCGSNHYEDIRFSQKASEWHERPSGCHPVQTIDDNTVQTELAKRMKAKSVPSAWLPIKRMNLHGWYWVGGEFHADYISSKEWVKTGQDCAVLRSLDKIVDDVHCDRRYGFYMCQGFSECDTQAYKCIRISGKLYNLYNSTGTWYDAVNNCHISNQTLVAIGKAQLMASLHAIAQATNRWANIWIGLRRREFQKFVNETSGAPGTQLSLYKWGENEPSSLEGKNCVTIGIENTTPYWRTTYCNASNFHVCQGRSEANVLPQITSKMINVSECATLKTESGSTVSQSKFTIASAVLLALLLIVISSIAVFLIIMQHPSGRTWLREKYLEDQTGMTHTQTTDQQPTDHIVSCKVATNGDKPQGPAKAEVVTDTEGSDEGSKLLTNKDDTVDASDIERNGAEGKNGEDQNEIEIDGMHSSHTKFGLYTGQDDVIQTSEKQLQQYDVFMTLSRGLEISKHLTGEYAVKIGKWGKVFITEHLIDSLHVSESDDSRKMTWQDERKSFIIHFNKENEKKMFMQNIANLKKTEGNKDAIFSEIQKTTFKVTVEVIHNALTKTKHIEKFQGEAAIKKNVEGRFAITVSIPKIESDVYEHPIKKIRFTQNGRETKWNDGNGNFKVLFNNKKEATEFMDTITKKQKQAKEQKFQ